MTGGTDLTISTPGAVPPGADPGAGAGPATLAATVWLPAGPAAPHPGVVMTGGSGPTDRHNDTLFPPIREHLLAAGVAVLSYDKRGVGGSTGDWTAGDHGTFAADMLAARDALRAHPGVDPSAVGLFGHSEGGSVALKAAARATLAGDDVAYVVTNSPSAVTAAAQERYATETALRGAGVPESDLALALACHDRLTGALLAARPLPEVLTWLPADPGYALVFPDGALPSEPMWTFYQRMMPQEPTADLDALTCPHLALFGADDDHVPVAAGATAFAASAARRGARGQATFTLHVFPGRHRIGFDPATGTFAEGYLDALSTWILARTPVARGESTVD